MSTKHNLKIHTHATQNGQNLATTAPSASLSSSPISNSPIVSSPISNDESNTSEGSNSDSTSNEYNVRIQSGMEKASQLIVGYIRNSRLHFSSSNCINNCLCDNRMELICGIHTNIPLAIISIITHFYPKMNGKLFCWHIDNPNIIKNFINAKHKQRFASDIFEMKNLKWYLSAYPNGDRKEGSCTVYLTLISFPSIWSKFICNYSIYCNQTRSSATYITTYTEKRSQSGRIAGLLSINEIKNKYNNRQLNAITFSVNVNILQIYDKNIIDKGFENNHKHSKKGLLIYQYKLLSTKGLKNKYIIIWNVNKFMVHEFLRSDAIKQYETDVYYDMFCLAFCPNGGWRENAGQARLSLKLCCLPSEISKIKVKMELLCVETETYYSDICDFGYDSKNTVRAWPTDMLLTPQLNGLNKLTFKCMIFIIAKYDINGNEIIDIPKNDTFEKIINVNNKDIIDGDIDGVQNQLSIESMAMTTSQLQHDTNVIIKDTDIQSQIKQMMVVLNGLNNQINNIKNMLDDTSNYNDIDNNDDIDNNINININMNGCNNDKREQVKYWINNIVCMKEYYDIFVQNGIDDIDIIKDLNMDELIEIGINKLGHRKKIMNEIDKLKNIKISNVFWKLYSPKKVD